MEKKYVDFATGEKVTLEEWNRRNNARKSGQAKTSYSFTEQPKKDYSPLQGIKAPVQNTIQPTFKPSAQPMAPQTIQPIYSPVSVNPQNTPIQTSKYRFAVGGKPKVEPIFKTYTPQKQMNVPQKATIEKPDYSWWDKLKETTVGAVKIGYAQADRGQEIGQAIVNGDMAKAEKLMKQSSPQYKTDATGWIEKGIRGAFQMLGQQVNQVTDPRTQAMGLGSATVAAIAGQAGPQVFTPEELLTVPGAYLAGTMAGSAIANTEIESGFAYEELIEAGVDKNLARNIALGVGAVNGLLEFAQVDELIKSYKIFEKSGVDDKVKKSFLSKIATELTKRGLSVTKEVGQEVAQEGVTIAGSNLGRSMSGIQTDAPKEIGARLGETAVSSALTFGFMNAPGAAMDISSAKQGSIIQQNATVSTPETIDTETKTFLENVAKKTGINIEVAEIVSKDGKQMSSAEGYYDRSQNKMVFAPDTSKANIIKGVAMHELTHSIEGSKFYEEYSDFTINTKYKNQQEFENEIQAKIQQYAKQGIELKSIDAQKEIVAELTRNTIFDEASINKLVAEKPNIAVQVYQSIVKAIDTAKAYLTGDTETLELEKARKLFEKALNDRGIGREGKQYSLYTDSSKQEITSSETSINSSKLPAVFNRVEFKPNTINLDIGGGKFDNATEFLKTNGVTNYIYDPYNRTQEYNAKVASKTENGQSDTVTISNVLNVIKEKEARKDVLRNAVDALKSDGTAYITVYEGDKSGEGKETSKGYQLNKKLADYVSEVSEFFDDVSVKNGIITAKEPIQKDTRQMSFKDNISTAGVTAETTEDAKREWKEKGTDSKYFKKWFGDSKVVDKDGKPLVMYHGSPNSFNVFDKNKAKYSGTYGKGFYFTNSDSHASTYGNLYKVYLKVENPVDGNVKVNENQVKKFLQAVSENEDYSIENYGTYDIDEVFGRVNKKNLFNALNDINVTAIGDMVEAVKLYNEVNSTNYDGIVTDTETVVFEPTQIKSVDNIGTFDENNPDIRYSVKDDKQKTKRSEFYDNTLKRATAIPQEVKDKLNPESFDFIPESSKEWQSQAEKNVNADMEGVIEKLKNAPSISGGIEVHEAAAVSRKIVGEIMKANDDEGNKLNNYFVMVASKTRESARALKATDTAWDKTEPAAAIVRAHREIQKVTDNEKKRNPKKFADAESEKKQLKTKMKNAEKLAKKDKAEKKLTDEQAKKIEDKRKKQMLERWVRDMVPRAKQKNMLEKIQEMYEAGAYNDEALSRLVSEKRDIPYLSLDEVKQIIRFIDKANASEQGSYEQRMAFSRAEQIVESKLPVTTRDKIKAFPRISILTGTGTQARNVVGNVIHGTYEAARENTVGLLVDVITSKFTGERKLTGNAIGKTSAYMKGFNMGVSEWYKDIKNKVDTSPTRTRGEVKRNSRTFKSAFLNAIDSVVKKGLSLGDRPFYQGAYEARLYELGKLNEKSKTKMSIDEMVLDAQAYALDKVYQNDSTVKKVATRLRNVSTAIDNPFWQGVAEVGMTMTVPFTETPANIFDKVLENSPIGITKAAIELGKTKNGTFDQMKFVQSLSRGLTGTGLMAAGAMLFAKGLIAIVPYDEEYDKYRFLQSMGVQNYALKVGDKYYSLSWVEPIATPLLIGAEISRGKDDDKNILENLYGTTKIAIDSFFEASFVQGIKEVFSSRSIGEGISNKLLDAHSMFTPLSAFGKALTQWVDPYVRETKDNSPLMQMLKERVAETPFLSKTLPTRIDVFGNEMKTLDGENHVFNVFFNPANVTDYVTTEVHDELIKMYDTTKDVNIFPDYISKSGVTYDGNTVELDERGLEKHKKEIGRALYDEYEKLFKTDTYTSMTADEKAKAIRDAKTDIKNQANFKAIKSSGDFLSGLTQNKQLYYDKTDLKLEADYLKRWEELTPQDNKTVRDARLYDAVSGAVKAFDKSGLLSKDSMAKIKQYAENKRKREPTMMDLQLIAVYRATGEASVFNTNYQGLLEFTDEKVPRIINYPKNLLPELLAKSDSAVLEAYSKVMLSNNWLKMTSVQKFEALKKAKDKARKAFEEDLKNKYGARIDTSARKWQSLTPQEKALVK